MEIVQDTAAQGMAAHSAVEQEPVPAARTMGRDFAVHSGPRADPPVPYRAEALAQVARDYTDKVYVQNVL